MVMIRMIGFCPRFACRLPVIFFLLAMQVPAGAQDFSGYSLKKDSVFSAILGEWRYVSICLPDEYKDSARAYPAIYLLDATQRLAHTLATCSFLNACRNIRKPVIIGIHTEYNPVRNRDFAPTATETRKLSGGADNFLAFLEKELMPWITSNFRVSGFDVLVGHSMGGLFAMHVLINRPLLFEGFLMMDSSFYDDNFHILNQAEAFLASGQETKCRVHISGCTNTKNKGVDRMIALFQSAAPDSLQWGYAMYDNENHQSVTFKSLYDGLRYVFE